MRALFSVELRRYVARRAIRYLSLLVLLGIIAAAVTVFFLSKDSPGAWAQARAKRVSDVAECVSFATSEGQGEVPPEFEGNPARYCSQEAVPALASGYDPRFHYTDLREVMAGTSILLILLGLAFGASFIGAEWGSGTVSTLLTWEPRRIRVLLTKVLAAVTFVFAAVIAAQSILMLALVPAAVLRGTMAGVDGSWLALAAGVVAKGAAVGAVAAAIGFAMASIARNTAAAIITGFVYLTVLEGIVGGLRPAWQPWLLAPNAGLFIIGSEDFSAIDRSTAGAGLLLVGYAAALVAIAIFFFRRRDVS